MKKILEILPSYPKVKRIVVDFEAAMWRAFPDVLNGVEVKGCVFHWIQAVWRKVQELGLQSAYMNDDATQKYIRKLFALPFLPATHIRPMFERLVSDDVKGNSPSLGSLTEYIRNTWFTGIFTPESWSVFKEPVRTNNDVEGWHRRLNSRGRPNMPFYSLVNLLSNEADLVPVQVKLVSAKKLKRYQRTAYAKTQGRIYDAWDKYEKGLKNAYELLKTCARIYAPTGK